MSSAEQLYRMTGRTTLSSSEDCSLDDRAILYALVSDISGAYVDSSTDCRVHVQALPHCHQLTWAWRLSFKREGVVTASVCFSTANKWRPEC